MKVLLDTHFIVWMVTRPELVRAPETAIIIDRGNDVRVSVISLWEIRVKWEARGGRGSSLDLCDVGSALSFVAASGFPLETLTSDVVIERLSVAFDHPDPFDRMLLVHAQHLGARLLTRDRHLRAHPLSLPL